MSEHSATNLERLTAEQGERLLSVLIERRVQRDVNEVRRVTPRLHAALRPHGQH